MDLDERLTSALDKVDDAREDHKAAVKDWRFHLSGIIVAVLLTVIGSVIGAVGTMIDVDTSPIAIAMGIPFGICTIVLFILAAMRIDSSGYGSTSHFGPRHIQRCRKELRDAERALRKVQLHGTDTAFQNHQRRYK